MSAAIVFGKSLREARESRGLTAQQVAAQTQIPIGDIEALEAGCLHGMPGGLYLRAEVRAYAETVGLDPVRILAELRRVLEASEGPALTTATSSDGFQDEPRHRAQPLPDELRRPLLQHTPSEGNRVPSGGEDTDRPMAPATLPHPPEPPRPPTPRAQVVRTARDSGIGWAAAAVLLVGAGALLWDRTSDSPRGTGGISTPADVALPDQEAVSTPEGMLRAQTGEAVWTIVPSTPPTVAPHASRRGLGSAVSGQLVVSSTPPGARVTVNGVGWGETPVTIRHLPFGTMRVRLVKDSYVAAERLIDLTSEMSRQTVRVALRGARRSTVSSTRAESLLRVTTRPEGARVTVNGIGWGTTPLEIPVLAPGVQRVRVVQDGYRSEERVVTVGSGRPSRVVISMKPVS